MERAFFHQHLQFTRSFKKRLNEQLVKVGLHHSQWLIVYYLKRFESTTLVEISNYLDVEKPTITRTVNRLEEQQLVKNVPSADKRKRRIQLTEKGLKVYEEAIPIVTTFEQMLMDEIPEEDLEITARTLQKLKGKLR